MSFFRGIENLGIADAKGYLEQAYGITRGLNYIFAHPESFYHGLGFSFALSLTFLTGSTSLLFFKIILGLGHGIATWLVARIGILIGLRKPFWVGCTILFALDPFILSAASDIQTESQITLIVLYWTYLYLNSLSSIFAGNWNIIFFVISGIYSILIRPNFLFVFIAIAVILYYKWKKAQVKPVVLITSAIVFFGLLSVYEVFLTKLNSGFVFLANYGGFGVAYLCRPEFIPQYLGIATQQQNLKINQLVAVPIVGSKPNMSSSEMNSELIYSGISTCLAHPIQSAGLLVLKFFAVWRPSLVFGAYGWKMFIVSLLIWIPTTATLIWLLFKKRPSEGMKLLRTFFMVAAVAFTFSVLFTTSTHSRHRIAFAEPFYWISSMLYLDYLVRKRSLRKSSKILKLQ